MSYRRKHLISKILRLKKNKPFFRRPVFWTIFLLTVLIGLGVYFYLFFPKIQVLQIEISGNETLEDSEIEAIIWPKIQKSFAGITSASIFAVSKRKLQHSLLAAFPLFEKVAIEKRYFNRVALKIVERSPVGVFCSSQNGCFFIDAAGIIFSTKGGSASSGDPSIPLGDVIVFRGETNAQAGQVAVEKNIVEGVLTLERNLKNNFQIDVKEVIVSNPLIIKTSEHWKMYVDPAADMNLQVSKMNALLGEISPTYRKQLTYIYLQYKDRAYYK